MRQVREKNKCALWTSKSWAELKKWCKEEEDAEQDRKTGQAGQATQETQASQDGQVTQVSIEAPENLENRCFLPIRNLVKTYPHLELTIEGIRESDESLKDWVPYPPRSQDGGQAQSQE
jgi:hypothetical protein